MANFRQRLLNQKTPIIIGIAGDSGSGKTTYSNGIRRMLGTDLVKTITMDGYHKENRQQRLISGKLPLDPQANKLDLFKQHLKLLRKGEQIKLPIYNHKTGDFNIPISFIPSPIIIIEGLHTLYPEFLPFYDLTIFVDPSREVKWKWKYERDMEKRRHEKDELTKEMLQREAAYKKWVDFQKTNANIVVKINNSKIPDFARYELIEKLPSCCYKVELIVESTPAGLPTLSLPFDLSKILSIDEPPFLLSCVPSLYWGKKVVVIHLDGIISQKTVEILENQIASLTGIEVDKMLEKLTLSLSTHENLTAVQLAQLLIVWKFLELVN